MKRSDASVKKQKTICHAVKMQSPPEPGERRFLKWPKVISVVEKTSIP
jgi:hypothetical protein